MIATVIVDVCIFFSEHMDMEQNEAAITLPPCIISEVACPVKNASQTTPDIAHPECTIEFDELRVHKW